MASIYQNDGKPLVFNGFKTLAWDTYAHTVKTQRVFNVLRTLAWDTNAKTMTNH